MTAPPKVRAGRREWVGLAVLAVPTLLLAVDNSVLFLALPEIGADLGPSSSQTLWIMDSYSFMMAGFLITMGTLGDRIGRRRLLLIGAMAFGVASAAAAYAPTPELLIAARAAMGVAGAMVMPSTLALITDMFTEARQRGLAIAVWSSCFSAGAALGPVIGGVLLDWFWWGAVFLMGVPVMAVLVVLTPVLLPERRVEGAGRLELTSVVLSLAAILPVVYGLKELAKDPGLVPLLPVVVGLAVGVVFVCRQRRLADPLLDLGLFASRSFRGALVVVLGGMAAMGGMYLVVSQFLQLVAGMSALAAGVWLVPAVVTMIVGAMAAPLLSQRFRPGLVVAAALAVSAAGYLLLMLTEPDGGLAVPMVGFSLGMFGGGVVGTLGIELLVGSAPAGRAGSASSVAEAGGELGVALGVAAFGSLATAVQVASAGSADVAFTDGVVAVAGASGLLAAGLAVLAVALLRHLRPNR